MPFQAQRFAVDAGERLDIFRVAAERFRVPVSGPVAVRDEARAILLGTRERGTLAHIAGDRAKLRSANVDIAARAEPNPNNVLLLPERELLASVRGVRAADLEKLGGEHVNEVYRVFDKEGRPVAIYKPILGRSRFRDHHVENPDLLPWREAYPPDTTDLLARERGFWLLDYRIGYGRIPVTTVWNGPHGKGSLMQFLPDSRPGLLAGEYSKLHSDEMAVLDYVSGNTDRNFNNLLTVDGIDPNLDQNNGPVPILWGIDHEFTFPRVDHPGMLRMLSDHVARAMGEPLHPLALSGARSISPERLGVLLPGMGGDAIGPAAARLREIQHRGMITGETWKAPIHVNGKIIPETRTFRGSLPL